MKELTGKTVAIAAKRRSNELKTLIENTGGTAEIYSIQGEQVLTDSISEADVRELTNGTYPYAILTTGIGVQTLEKAAIRLDRADEFLDKLKKTKIYVRGSKTMKWLKEHGVTPDSVSEDGTMEALLETLPVADEQTALFLQSYNEDSEYLKKQLEKRNYTVYISRPYQYKNPEKEVMEGLINRITEQRIDAVVFTSKTQVKNLFADADKNALLKAFDEKVLAVAVGKVTARTLEEQGVKRVYYPENQRMGAMVVGMGNYFQQQKHNCPFSNVQTGGRCNEI